MKRIWQAKDLILMSPAFFRSKSFNAILVWILLLIFMTSYKCPNSALELHLGKGVKDESRESISKDVMLLSAAAPLIFFALHKKNISLWSFKKNVLISVDFQKSSSQMVYVAGNFLYTLLAMASIFRIRSVTLVDDTESTI